MTARPEAHWMEGLGQLAGGVAHDFNNLLAVIVNYTSFVEEAIAEAAAGVAGDQWATVQLDIAQIQLAARRATDLTHHLLIFARRDIPRPEPLQLDQVVVSLLPGLRTSTADRIQVDVRTDAPLAQVVTDRGGIERVVHNLVTNACDAMPGDGCLSLHTHNLVVGADGAEAWPGVSPGRYVRLHVTDTGPGMSPEVLDRVFEPFFTTRTSDERPGLGLATVYGLVNRAGGYSQADSVLGSGTTVTVLIPAAQAVAVLDDIDPVAVPRPLDQTHSP